MRRRELMLLLGGAMIAAAPLRAQQKAVLVIGYLSSRSLSDSQDIIAAFHQGLSEAGFVDKQNVLIEYRFAEFNSDRLSGLAAELVRRQVNVLVATGGTVSAVKAKLVLPTDDSHADRVKTRREGFQRPLRRGRIRHGTPSRSRSFSAAPLTGGG